MQVMALIANPFDPSLAVGIMGPPWPLGAMEWVLGGRRRFTIRGGETALCLSDRGYLSQSGDSPADTWFQPRLLQPFSYEMRLFDGAEPGAGATARGGDITIANSRDDVVIAGAVVPDIELVGTAKIPSTDNGVNDDATAVSITPPVGMAENDFVLVTIVSSIVEPGLLDLSETGGQVWEAAPRFSGGAVMVRLFTCVFDGAWTADPAFSAPSDRTTTIHMSVWRGVDPLAPFDVPVVASTRAADFDPFNGSAIEIEGTITRSAGAAVIAGWATGDNTTWSSLTSGWLDVDGNAQWRNSGANDHSMALAWKTQDLAGPTGAVKKNNSGADMIWGAACFILALRPASPSLAAFGDLSPLADYGWDGRAIRLYRGAHDAAFSDFALVFNGTADGVDLTDRVLSIHLRDAAARLDVAIETSLYGGTGGLEGDSGIAGLARPLCWGAVENVAPVLIDSTNRIYQFGTGPAQAVTAVRDKGGALIASSDYGSYADLLAATVAEGDYATCLSESLIRTGGAAAGLVTCDVEGETTGGYVNKTADIVERIATARLGANSFSSDDVLGVAEVNSAQPAVVGYYLDRSGVPASAVLNELMGGIGGYVHATRLGKLQIGILAAPESPADHSLDVANIHEGGWRWSPAIPSQVRRVGYRRMWRVQSADELAPEPTVDDDARRLYGAEYRWASSSAGAVLHRHRFARDVDTPALFATAADAEAEASRLAELHSSGRGALTFRAGLIDPFDIAPGDIVAVDHGRFSGRYFAVIGLAIDVANESLSLELWG